ncbi:tetratricopeptide repeat protein [Alginatibacterium sediminis]|nr:tetratricopeptide repeat protein [Alginatibacterium sediminis]
MNTWKEVMGIGNHFLNQQNWAEAERHFEEAIYMLEEILSKNPRCVASIQGWIGAHHNLAEMFQNVGKLEDAQRCLLIPHQSMLHVYNHNKDPDLQLIALSAIKITLTPLLKFASLYPPCESCLEQLELQAQLAYRDEPTYH